MEEKAKQMLAELEAQVVYLNEQLLMARGALQAVQHLLSYSTDGDNVQDDPSD